MTKPMWITRKWRRMWGRCPWCAKPFTKGFVGLFLHGVIACPDGHYAEEVVMCAGVIVYEDGGRDMRQPKEATP